MYLTLKILCQNGTRGFVQLYELVLPHLRRCSVLCFYCIRVEMIPKIFPLPLMPRLHAIIIFGQTPNVSPVILFANPASALHVKEAAIIGVPVTKLPENPIDKPLVARNHTANGWVLLFVASSQHITIL
ncbi:hypothetical protein DL93DRAFT_1520725 [Clavulina sp. PMI_390]|nr:hypothetical protein DL93DRAFT_1520725 [Clavulina sp. PMI_390]